MRVLLLAAIVLATAAVSYIAYQQFDRTARLEAAAERVRQEQEEQESGQASLNDAMFISTDPTSASGVEIDPSKHRAVTFEMW